MTEPLPACARRHPETTRGPAHRAEPRPDPVELRGLRTPDPSACHADALPAAPQPHRHLPEGDNPRNTSQPLPAMRIRGSAGPPGWSRPRKWLSIRPRRNHFRGLDAEISGRRRSGCRHAAGTGHRGRLVQLDPAAVVQAAQGGAPSTGHPEQHRYGVADRRAVGDPMTPSSPGARAASSAPRAATIRSATTAAVRHRARRRSCRG